MPRPVTPLCGCDAFVLNHEKKILLIRRADNGLWAMPGGLQNTDETPVQCTVRECFEETGFKIRVTRLVGVWSSLGRERPNDPYKHTVYTHLVYQGEWLGGSATPSDETTDIRWFGENELPQLSDGHDLRIAFGFRQDKEPGLPPYFE